MPEGHSIARIARQQRRSIVGKRLDVSSPQGRFADGAAAVSGRALDRIETLGKHLFYHFAGPTIVHVHLGMYGKFRNRRVPKAGNVPEPMGQVRMRLLPIESPQTVIDLSGPTACDVLTDAAAQTIRDRIGPDLLDPDADAGRAWDRISKSRAPIGTLLMDQSVLCGIGNAYRAEVLYRQAMHPLRPGKSLSRQEFDALWADAAGLLRLGVKHGNMLCVDPEELGKPLSEATRGDRFQVYRRDTCRRCGAAVEELKLAGRRCFHCPAEQREIHE